MNSLPGPTGAPATPPPDNKTDGPSKTTPEPPIHGQAARIRATLAANPSGGYEDTLSTQAAILDAIFRQLVLEGSNRDYMSGLNLALRAQTQFRGIWQGLENVEYQREKIRAKRRTDK